MYSSLTTTDPHDHVQPPDFGNAAGVRRQGLPTSLKHQVTPFVAPDSLAENAGGLAVNLGSRTAFPPLAEGRGGQQSFATPEKPAAKDRHLAVAGHTKTN
jgi:hypothetical protein